MNSIGKMNRFGERYLLRLCGPVCRLHMTSVRDCSSKETTTATVPNYIPRQSTDILRVLSQTVGNDYTAAHFKYQDDPYLIPTSNANKRVFALAQQAGRKAASWIRKEHSDLFQHVNADPPIEAFMADNVYTEKTDQVSEVLLLNLIKQFEVTDAITVYDLLEKNGSSISNDTKQQLLELICYSNADDVTSEEWIEERWFKQSMTGRTRNRKSWKDNDLAERLFEAIEPKSSETYDAIIRGMSKYFQAEKACHLFEKACHTEGVRLNVDTYNALITASNFLAERDLKWDKLNEILKMMNANGITPNLGTLNNALAALGSINTSRPVRKWALSLLAEFRQFPHIVPSLATWYHMLVIFCRDNGPTSHILVNILDEIQNQHFIIRHPRDIMFFVTAMDVACNHLQDKDVANRVHNLLLVGDNYNLIGDSFKESIYYRHYFNLLSQSEPLEVFMETYNRLVPNIYIPEPSIMETILKQIELESAFETVPLIWSHMIIFDQTAREGLLTILLNIMASAQVTGPMAIRTELLSRFGQIAWEVFERVEELNESRNLSGVINWTGKLLGNILLLLARADNYANAWTIVQKLDQNQHKIIGVADKLAMEEFIILAVRNKEPTAAIKALQYCVENGHHGCTQMATVITDTLNLSNFERSKVQNLVKI